MDEASAAADRTRAKIAEAKAALVEEQRYGAWADQQAEGQKNPLSEESKAKQAEITAEIKEQEKVLAKQVKEVDKTANAYQTADAKVERITRALTEQETAAGKVEKSLAKAYVPEKLQAAGASVKIGFKNILKYAFGIRSLYIAVRKLREMIVSGVKEMTKFDPATNKAMTSITNAWSKLKASVASAAAPILQALAPAMTKLIEVMTKGIEIAGMFFTAISGKTTYTRAIANQQDYAKSLDKTAAAAKKAKNYLSGLDEIRTYTPQDTDASDSSSAGAIIGTEQVEIPDKFKAMGNWILDHLNEIKDAALAVGLAIAGWKISKLFSDGLLDTARKVIGLTIAIKGLKDLIKDFVDAWQNGLDWENLSAILKDITLIVIGLGVAFGPLGIAIGAIIGAIVLLVLGLRDWIETGKLSEEAAVALIAAIALIGVAFLALGNPLGAAIALVVATLAAIAYAIYANWDTIKEWAAKAWEAIKQWFSNLTQFAKDTWANVKSGVSSAFNAIKQTLLEKIDTMKNGVKQKFEDIKSTISGILQKIKSLFNFSWQFPKPKMPHFNWEWQNIGGILSIPRVWIDWYARGGIVDGTHLIGAGEDGKEAIVPLERHTEWIDMVANRLGDLLVNRLETIYNNVPIPAVATGSVIPPRMAVEIEGVEDLRAEIRALAAAISGQRSGDYRFTAEINRKTIFDEMISEARIRQAATGRNPLAELR